MYFEAEIEKVREMLEVVENWGIEREYIEIWGSHNNNSEKVKASKRHDSLENRIIHKLEEFDNKQREYMKRLKELYTSIINIIISKARTEEDKKILIQYTKGYSLEKIDFTGTIKALWKFIKSAIAYIQEELDILERLPQNIKKVIAGSKAKCKKCDTGHIYYISEDIKRFMFRCDQCDNKIAVYKHKYV